MPSFPNSVKQFGSLDQRDDIFAEVMALETFCLGTDQKLTTMAAVDMNTATATTLYVVPTGKSCLISKVIMRLASTSLTTVSVSFGWTSTAFADVIANATHTELTGNTLYTILFPMVGAKVGTAAATFKVLDNTLQGGAATVTIDVYGILF
jgi:hypothetical protein